MNYLRKCGLLALSINIILTGCHKTEPIEPDVIETQEVIKEENPMLALETQVVHKVSFTPPENWRIVEAKDLLPSVKLMVVGEAQNSFPPSINLSVENYSGDLNDYLKRVAQINQTNGNTWKDLGLIRTAAGNASYSQIDKLTEWGEVRMMHVILQYEGMTYVMTAAALKPEFAIHYRTFFNAFKSLTISD